MSARAPVTVRRTTAAPCACVCATHPRAGELDAELRVLDASGRPDGHTLASLSERYGISRVQLSQHRVTHLGLPPLPRGPAAKLYASEEQREAKKPPAPVKVEPKAKPLPPTPEGNFTQLVKTVATLIALGSYRGVQTVRALAARHQVSEAEVLRAHRRASLSVRDARGGLREQLELSVGFLTQVRDQERQVADDYTGIAQRIVATALPGADGAPPQAPTQAQLEKARVARSVAAQAQDCALAAQRQIDQNTIHRRTAPVVQVSFSASPDFNRAQDALVLLLCAVVGPDREEEARQKVARGLQVLEDAGENLDAPEFLEYLAELRQDAGAVIVEAEKTEEV